MMSWPILSVTTFLPLVGALFIMMMRSDGDAEQRNARWVALWTIPGPLSRVYRQASRRRSRVIAAGLALRPSWVSGS